MSPYQSERHLSGDSGYKGKSVSLEARCPTAEVNISPTASVALVLSRQQTSRAARGRTALMAPLVPCAEQSQIPPEIAAQM